LANGEEFEEIFLGAIKERSRTRVPRFVRARKCGARSRRATRIRAAFRAYLCAIVHRIRVNMEQGCWIERATLCKPLFFFESRRLDNVRSNFQPQSAKLYDPRTTMRDRNPMRLS
jgi:hypothetical protein